MNMTDKNKKNKNENYEKPAFEKVKTGEDIIRSSTESGSWSKDNENGQPESGSADIFGF